MSSVEWKWNFTGNGPVRRDVVSININDIGTYLHSTSRRPDEWSEVVHRPSPPGAIEDDHGKFKDIRGRFGEVVRVER